MACNLFSPVSFYGLASTNTLVKGQGEVTPTRRRCLCIWTVTLPLHIPELDVFEEFLGVPCRCHGSISLPNIILVRIAIVGDSSNDDAREMVHQPRGFHLETDCPVFLLNLISRQDVSIHGVARGDDSIVDPGCCVGARGAVYQPLAITVDAEAPGNVV